MDEGLDVEDNSLLVNVVNFPGSESEEQGAETLLDIGSHDHSYAIAAGTTAGHPSMRSDDKEEKDNNDLGAGEGVGEDSVVVGKRKSVMRRDELLNGDDNGVYVILPEGLDSEEEESFIVSIAMEGKEEKQLPQQQQQQQQEAEPSSLPTNQPPAAIPTKWDIYGQRIVKLARTLARKSKTVLRKDGDTAELFKYQIYTLKRRIRSILLEISQLNAADRQFPSLLEGTEAEDMINVETVVCSKCGLSDEINNDILLCDKVNCCRAYHQNCLEPRVDVSLIKDEPYWFC